MIWGCVRGLFFVLLLTGCQPDQTDIVVGDGVARQPIVRDDGKQITLLDVVRDALDSSGGRPVRLQSWGQPPTLQSRSEVLAAETFVNTPGIVAVIGHSGSKTTLMASPVYREARIPLLVPTATARQLATLGPLVFMLAPTDEVEGRYIANQAIDSLAAKRIAIMYVADAYGTGIRDGVAAQLAERGTGFAGSAALAGRECSSGPLALRGVVRALLQRSKPDLVVLAVAPGLATCAIRELMAADSGIRILAADSFGPPPNVTELLNTRERAAVWSVLFWEPGQDSLSQSFVSRTLRMTGREPNAGDALAYDGFMLVATAVKAGNRTPAAVMRWLRSLGTPGTPPFAGVTGPIAFNTDRSGILRLHSLADTIRFK